LAALALPAKDESLPRRYFDPALGGEWKDHRDCHIRPDLVLIYRKPDEMSLDLVRLGSHSELGLQPPQIHSQTSSISSLHAGKVCPASLLSRVR
jgi:hypothetical protein